MERIPAVETFYNGIRFRSRLEARWAVFFDVLGIDYLYEPEKFQIGPDRYIPDFLLPNVGCDLDLGDESQVFGVFIEIKGTSPTNEEKAKANSLLAETGIDVSIVYGGTITTGLSMFAELPCFFSQCPFCGRFGMGITSKREQEGTSHLQTGCKAQQEFAKRYNVPTHFSRGRLVITPHSPALDIAYEAARSMRFEDRLSSERVCASHRAVQVLMNTGTFCTPSFIEQIIAAAHNYAKAPRTSAVGS